MGEAVIFPVYSQSNSNSSLFCIAELLLIPSLVTPISTCIFDNIGKGEELLLKSSLSSN
jgi:hypothetical protein